MWLFKCMMHTWVLEEDRRVSSSLELEWQEFVSCSTWVLGAELSSSARGITAFHSLSSPGVSGLYTRFLGLSVKSCLQMILLPQNFTFLLLFFDSGLHILFLNLDLRPLYATSPPPSCVHWKSSPAMRLLASVAKKHQVPFCPQWTSSPRALLGGVLSSFYLDLWRINSHKPLCRGAAYCTNHPAASREESPHCKGVEKLTDFCIYSFPYCPS